MKIITGATGQAHVNAADDGALYAALFGTSQFVLPIENQLEAEVIATTRIRIKSGDVMVHGRHARIPHGTYDELTIDNGTSGYKRNDIIVCHYEETDGIESMVLKVLKGTPTTGTPKDPDVVEGNILNGDSVHEFPLYRVRLNGINLDGLDKLFSVWDAGTNHKHTMNQIDGTLPMDRVTGTLPLDRTSGVLAVEYGGTGCTTIKDVRDTLGIKPNRQFIAVASNDVTLTSDRTKINLIKGVAIGGDSEFNINYSGVECWCGTINVRVDISAYMFNNFTDSPLVTVELYAGDNPTGYKFNARPVKGGEYTHISGSVVLPVGMGTVLYMKAKVSSGTGVIAKDNTRMIVSTLR